MSEWKDGDEAMVTLYRVHGHLAEVECGDYLRTVHVECLHPLPTDQHQALKDAVIAAAGEVRTTAPVTDGRLRAIIKMFYAIDALTAAQTPPKLDLVEVFTNAIRPASCVSICARYVAKLGPHCYDGGGRECHDAIEAGLAAVEAARGAK